MMELDRYVGEVLDDKYRLERLLGKGGMGAVYLATHLGTERYVALKLIAPQFMRNEEFGPFQTRSTGRRALAPPECSRRDGFRLHQGWKRAGRIPRHGIPGRLYAGRCLRRREATATGMGSGYFGTGLLCSPRGAQTRDRAP